MIGTHMYPVQSLMIKHDGVVVTTTTLLLQYDLGKISI